MILSGWSPYKRPDDDLLPPPTRGEAAYLRPECSQTGMRAYIIEDGTPIIIIVQGDAAQTEAWIATHGYEGWVLVGAAETSTLSTVATVAVKNYTQGQRIPVSRWPIWPCPRSSRRGTLQIKSGVK